MCCVNATVNSVKSHVRQMFAEVGVVGLALEFQQLTEQVDACPRNRDSLGVPGVEVDD